MADYPDYRYEQKLDRLTRRFFDIANDTDAITASTVITGTSSTPVTLLSLPIPQGAELIVGEVDVFTSTSVASVEFLLSYSYTIQGTTYAGAKYYLLDPALNKMVFDKQSFDDPVMAALAATNFNLTLKVLNPGVGGIYGGTVKYVVR